MTVAALAVIDPVLKTVFLNWSAIPGNAAFFIIEENVNLQLRTENTALILYDGTLLLETYGLPCRLGSMLDSLRQILARRGDAALAQVRLTAGATLDALSQQLHYQNRTINLTGREVDILLYLYRHTAPVHKEQLLTEVWGYHPDMTTHTVETHMWRLRQKIEIDPERPQLIVTMPDGYQLAHDR